MLGFFKKKDNEKKEDDDERLYDPETVTVHYEGSVLSPEYANETLVFTKGKKLRQDFNTQAYPFHNLFPHGKGKLTYKDGDQILEQYEGDFIAGQYEGSGTLVDRHGEVFEGTFKENKFIKSKQEM